MRRISVFISMVLCFTIIIKVHAQNVDFDKAHFDDKAGLKKAQNALKEGNKAFDMGPENYNAAIPHFLEANGFNPNNAELNFKLGVCYINSAQRQKALPYVEKAYQLDPKIHPRIHYLLGLSYHLNMDWNKAISEYSAHQKAMEGIYDQEEMFVDVPKLIQECENGLELMKDPVSVGIENIGAGINSAFVDQGPVLSADGSKMYFTSRREGTTGGKKDRMTGQFFEDIYYVQQENGVWGVPVNVGPPINTDRNDAAVGLSNDGSRMIIYRGDRKSGDLYETHKVGSAWTNPERLNAHINSDFHEPSASYSFDNAWLYFVSDRPENNFGGLDIYRSRWNEDTQDWGAAENLGDVINSKYDEDGIFVHPDGLTIYFSSKGHNTMGGFDVFTSTKNENGWQRPKNIGYPVNTPDDDLFYVGSASGRSAYFSSIRSGGVGEDDIYFLQFNSRRIPMLNAQNELLAGLNTGAVDPLIEPPIEIEEKNLALLHGWIKNLKMLKGMEAYIEVIDLEDDELVARFMSDPETGEYLVALPAGKNYGINIRADGYLFHSENVNIPEGSGYVEFNKDITMKEIAIGNHVILKNIFFDPDQFMIKKESKSELDRLATLLRENPKIVLEISGHTDNTGTEIYNDQLSDQRAQAVVEYLNGLGIASTQLVAKGYGRSAPIASNDTEEGRAQNRRTEFKVVAK